MVDPSRKRILIAGAGIAGPVCATLLAQNGHSVTIVERASNFRDYGQQIDVDGAGLEVVKRMGLLNQIKERTTEDAGIRFVDTNDNDIAAFAAGTGGPEGLVKEIEIMRRDLANVFYGASKKGTNGTEYMFGDYITAISQSAEHATVSFNSGKDRDFDIVIAADGLSSKTRDIAFGKSSAVIKDLGMVVGYFTIPHFEPEGTWSRWYNAPGGRTSSTRPRPKEGKTGAYLCICSPDLPHIESMSNTEQKAMLKQRFSGTGWENDRILKEMESSEDLYMSRVAQVKAASWTKGRVALLGDAGYCPSPVSGQGTTLAIVGAYVLAGCICANDSVEEGLRQYERDMKPFVDKAQKLPPGVPQIANPQTAFGIWLFNIALRFGHVIVNYGIAGWIGWLSKPLTAIWPSAELRLPDYPHFRTSAA